jgi:hypothetical protein
MPRSVRHHIAPPVALVSILLLASFAGCLSEAANRPPVATAGANATGVVGEDVDFDGRGLDSDGSVVKFMWDFDGDGTWDYEGAYGARVHSYTLPGHYHARLRVVDDSGAKGDAYRWVNVTASVRINVNWTGAVRFQLTVSDRLDARTLQANWTLVGLGPTPVGRTFTRDAGLTQVDNTTYAFTAPVVRLDPGTTHTVKVLLGETEIASRTIEVVNASGPAGAYTASYYQEVSDYRTWWGWNFTNHYRNGTLSVEGSPGSVRGHFSGKGWEVSNRTLLGVNTYSNLNLTNVTWETGSGARWGRTWWREQGYGYYVSRGEGNLTAVAQVYDLDRAVENGTWTKDDWRRVGRYSGTNGTNGTFEWTRNAEQNMVHVGGDGSLYEVLRVRSVKDFEGTNRGLEFKLVNTTVDYDASRDIFENRTVFRSSQQDVGTSNATGPWVWANTTRVGFVDDNLDGRWNPDPVAFDPEESAIFTGPRPRVVEVGDRYAAQDPQGFVLFYQAMRSDSANLTTQKGRVAVHGVYVTAEYNTTWGHVWHWYWLLVDGPLPGIVYEESVLVEHRGYGGGSYRSYVDILQADAG